MVVYEVNLSIDHNIYQDYKHWLDEHIQEMLTFPGFLSASVMQQTMGDDFNSQKHVTVAYQVRSLDYLQIYFSEYAPKMMGDGLKRFEGHFTATRRTFEVELVRYAKHV